MQLSRRWLLAKHIPVTQSDPVSGPTRIAFLFIGGMHQVPHAAPAAAELSYDRNFAVTCLARGLDEFAMLKRVSAAWPDAPMDVKMLPELSLPAFFRLCCASLLKTKLAVLFFNWSYLNQFNAVVVPECTTTILKRIGLPFPPLLHIPHGGGDRAVAVERRLRFFDYIVAPNQKNMERMLSVGVAKPGHIGVSGWIKLSAVTRFSHSAAPLFDNDRPVVFYNPHFRESLGSWHKWGRMLVSAFATQEDFNLVLAPHIRMLQDHPAMKAELKALEIPGKILVDTGSVRSCDMSYTGRANIFVGDVSSQVYEFMSRPRPCVFLNAHGVKWQNNSSYASWHFGDVVEDASNIMSTIRNAYARHAFYRPLQEQELARSLGEDAQGAPARAAVLIRDFLRHGIVATQ